jgi:hypothetical protein
MEDRIPGSRSGVLSAQSDSQLRPGWGMSGSVQGQGGRTGSEPENRTGKKEEGCR